MAPQVAVRLTQVPQARDGPLSAADSSPARLRSPLARKSGYEPRARARGRVARSCLTGRVWRVNFAPSSVPVTMRPAQLGAGVPIQVRPPAGGGVVVMPRGRKVDTAYEIMRDIDSRREEMKASTE
jgi:hypothetical protein